MAVRQENYKFRKSQNYSPSAHPKNNFVNCIYERVFKSFLVRTQWHGFDLKLLALAKIKFKFIKLSTLC